MLGSEYHVAHIDDVIIDYNGDAWFETDNLILLTVGSNEGDYAHQDETVTLYNDDIALSGETTKITWGDHVGDYILDDDIVGVIVDGEEYITTPDDDTDGYETN